MTKSHTTGGRYITDDTDLTSLIKADINTNWQTAETDLATHAADTTGIHGITDTAALETTTGAQTKADTARDAAKAYALGLSFSSGGGGGGVGTSVKAAGAVGDGTADDTSAVQAAITATPAGGIVFFDAGTYKVTSTLTCSGKIFCGPGVIKAALGVVINVGGTGSVITGITINNDTGTQSIAFLSNAKQVTIRGVTFLGTIAEGIQINVTGVSDVLIESNTFDGGSTGIGYGVLTNSNATDLRDVRILNNTFKNISGDAIELNHPGTAYTGLHGCIISGNYISCNLGSGSTAGFGVGIAGASYVSVTGNHFYNCRNHSVHFEDECAQISINGNTIEGGAYGIWGLDGDYITISGNQLNGQTSGGISLTYDATNYVTHFSVTNNTVKGVIGTGISVGSDGFAQMGVISGNVVSGGTGDGFGLGATNSQNEGDVIFKDNVSTDNSGYGATLANLRMSVFGPNMFSRNALGQINKRSTSYNIPMQIRDPQGYGTGTVSGSYTNAVPVFQIGSVARGILIASASYQSQRATMMYDLTWDGTTLTTTVIGNANSGTVSFGAFTVVSGQLCVTAFSATNSVTVLVEAALKGWVIL